MTITLTIQGDATLVMSHLDALLRARGVPANTSAIPDPGIENVDPAKPNRRNKAPAAKETIEATAVDVTPKTEPEAVSGPMLTIDDARERMKQFAKDGSMDQVSEALAHFGVKKVSDIDPDAKSNPSAKFAEFVAKIEELVKGKAA